MYLILLTAKIIVTMVSHYYVILTTCHLIDFLFEIDATINTYVLTYTQPVVESSSKKNVSRTSGFGNAVEKWVLELYIYFFAFWNIL